MYGQQIIIIAEHLQHEKKENLLYYDDMWRRRRFHHLIVLIRHTLRKAVPQFLELCTSLRYERSSIAQSRLIFAVLAAIQSYNDILHNLGIRKPVDQPGLPQTEEST